MRHLFLFLLGIVIFVTQAIAAVETETHTYIVHGSKHKVIAIEKKSGNEVLIDVGEYPRGIEIYNGFGFVINYWSNSVSVIDLKTHVVTSTIPVGTNPIQMIIHRGIGYIVNFNSESISVVDLQKHAVTKEISVGKYPDQMRKHLGNIYVINGGSLTLSVIDLKTQTITHTLPIECRSAGIAIFKKVGYVVSLWAHTITLIDLKTHTVTKTISISSPLPMSIRINRAYVPHYDSATLSILNLETSKITRTLPVGRSPKQMVINDMFGYVVNEGSHTLSVIDLVSEEIIHTIPVGNYPQQLIIHNDFGYVRNDGDHTLSVIELRCHKVIQTFKIPHYSPIDFSNTHVYFGLKKGPPLPVLQFRLFNKVFNGIDLDEFFLDGNKAFSCFEVAALKNDDRLAKIYLTDALSMGHPKAYAVAFKALCHGLWGAPQDDEWAKEFCLSMDFNYLARLVTDPDHFSLLPEQKK